MNQPAFVRNPEESAWWRDAAFVVADSRPPIELVATTDGARPDDRYVAAILARLEDLDALVLAAAELVLDNYSYDHFQSLGVAESRLVEETPTAVAAAIRLQCAWFESSDGAEFELSFSAPWDDHHSFDVAFEDSEAVSCSVNG